MHVCPIRGSVASCRQLVSRRLPHLRDDSDPWLNGDPSVEELVESSRYLATTKNPES